MYLYLMYLRDPETNEHTYVKVGYTKNIGSVLEYNTKNTSYKLEVANYWEMPNGTTGPEVHNIKERVREQVDSVDRITTYEVFQQYQDLYLMSYYDVIFDILDHEVDYFTLPPHSVDLSRTVLPEYKEAITDVNELHNRLKRWMGNKTINQIAEQLPAFKGNLSRSFTNEQIDDEILNILTEIAVNIKNHK